MAKKTRSARRRLTDDERAERRERDRQLMAAAVEELRSSEGWLRWLRLRRHFHTYSLRNQILIAMQMPAATRVAGFKRWLGLGYAVRKGEHGILIFAPCPPSKKKVELWRKAGADPKERPRTFFRLAAVFDRSQVDPLPAFPGGPVPLDPPHQPIEGASLAWLLEPLCGFGNLIGSPVRIQKGATDGSYDKKDRRIRVNPVGEGFSPNAQIAVAIHELSHALVCVDREEGDPKLTYAEEEVVVECVAMAVCGTVGLDTSSASIPYMASWGTGEEIERYAAVVDRLARRLEDVVAIPMPEPAEAAVELAAA